MTAPDDAAANDCARTLDIEDPAALVSYLRQGGRIDWHEQPSVRVLAGGVSNRTVLVRRANGQVWVLKQALQKLRVQADWYADPARVHREAAGLRWLAVLLHKGATPRLVFEDTAAHVVAMEAVPDPHENWKQVLLAGRVEPGHIQAFARMLAELHGNGDHHRRELKPVFQDRSFFEKLRIEPYYGYAAECVPEAQPFVHQLIQQTRRRALTLVHGDYSPKNVLLQQERLILLDHEVIHWGDPAFDVGFAMTHLLSKAHHLPLHRAKFIDAAATCWRTYHESVPRGSSWAAELEPFAVRHTLACLLARVAGRSPLEYLDDAQRRRQTSAVLAMMNDPPRTMPELIRRFSSHLKPGQ